VLGRALWWFTAAVVVLAVWQYANGDLGNIVAMVWGIINWGAYYLMQILTALSSILADVFGVQVMTR